jgi:hypothetical protein
MESRELLVTWILQKLLTFVERFVDSGDVLNEDFKEREGPTCTDENFLVPLLLK